MQDLQTESLWSQISGECISGEMVGAVLELLPTQHMTFADFAALYPNGRVLAKPARGQPGSAYSDYFGSTDKLGVFGRADDFERLPGKSLVWGLRLESGPIAVYRTVLDSTRWVLIDDTEPPIALVTDSAGDAVAAFDLGDLDSAHVRALRLIDSQFVVEEAGLRWQAVSGRALARGSDLRPLPLISAFWFAWASFFPETRLVK